MSMKGIKIMEKDKILFTIGQFAKLHNINKRTLHFYDDIGLFSPEHKGDNGYRYYTYLQSPMLEMILALRELNMSIEEITEYMGHRSVPAFRSIIHTKTSEINNTIQRLKGIQKVLSEKERMLTLCEQVDLDEIQLVEYPEEHLLLSSTITGTCDDDYLAALIQHMQELRDRRQFNKSYGSMISQENIMAENFEATDCFFTRVESQNRKLNLFIKPKGMYVRAFFKGTWDNLPDTYRRIIKFAQDRNLSLKGYSYEEGINEITIDNMNEYITQITILCESNL